jgi:hypoxanthine-DNA glycosylase
MASCRFASTAIIRFDVPRPATLSHSADAERLTGLPPAITRTCRLLVLGSFPSAASLAAAQYYAHPQNRFWPIMGAILGTDLHVLSYRLRIAAVNAAGVGIWDVYGSCLRQGSLDSAIRAPEFNDFASLRRRAPGIARICLNGATAGRALRHLAALGFETRVLPSTSPANASQGFEYKLERWREALA